MTDSSKPLAEDEAHRLLARAVELDAQHERPITVGELRAIALEAGIAPEAFDQATLEELGRPPKLPSTRVSAAPWSNVVANLKAAAIFWLAVIILVRIGRVLEVGWEVRHLANILALAIGTLAAHRLGARLARTAFIGMGAALVAQWVIHLIYGISTVQGAAANLAVLGAGLLGAAGAAVAARLRRPPDTSNAVPATSGAARTAQAEDGSGGPAVGPRALRLGAV